MPVHDGFAVEIAVSERTLQDLLRVLYVANQIKPVLTANVRVTTAQGPGQLTTTLFIDLPRVRLSAASDGRYQVDLRAWGQMTIVLPAAGGVQRDVLVTASLLVPPQVMIAQNQMTFGFNAAAASLQALDISPLRGGPFPPLVQGVLVSGVLNGPVEQALRERLMSERPATVALDVLGELLTANEITIASRVVDGALLIGLNVTWSSEPVVDSGTGVLPGRVFLVPAIDSSGNPAELRNVLGSHGLAYRIHGRQLPMVFLQAFLDARSRAEDSGATLDAFSLHSRDGYLQITGRASGAQGSADVRFRIVPRLTTDRWPSNEVLRFDTTDVQVDATPADWVRLLEVIGGIVSSGVFAIGVERLVDAIRSGLANAIRSSASPNMARNQRFTLPNTRKPPVRLRIETFRVRTEGLAAGLSLTPMLPRPRILGTGRVFGAADGGTRLQIYTSLRLPADVLRTDPQLRVRWTIRRRDTDEIVDEIDRPVIEGGTQLRRDLPLAASMTAASVVVACRLYRTLAERLEDLFNGSRDVPLRYEPQLDASRPFVRWRARTMVPNVRVEADGSLTTLGLLPHHRVSRIHRTDLPGRCLFAATATRATFEYLDDLPFERSELARHREEVCDYCFFGGPDKSRPLI